jgi:hypothetical protein
VARCCHHHAAVFLFASYKVSREIHALVVVNRYQGKFPPLAGPATK